MKFKFDLRIYITRLACIALLLLSQATFAQFSTGIKRNVDDLSDDEVKLFMNKAQASGMSESDIEKAALTQGYTSADIAKMRERMVNISPTATDVTVKSNNQTVNSSSESRNNKTIVVNNPSRVNPPPPQEGLLNLEERKLLARPLDIYNDSLVTQYNGLQKRVANSLDKKIFGASLFQNDKLSFEPNMRIATPKNYQIGPDDELDIHIFGDVLDNFKVTVSPEGTVKILNLSPIYVNGLSIDVASERIISRLRQLYQGLNKPGSGSSAQVTLSGVRSIRVTLTGEVNFPGSYTVSSLATAFNALYMAGGPNRNGSFRNIRVIRDNKVIRTLDLYDFLLRADQKDNIRLNDQDIIRVGDYENRVELIGEVKRPYIYELSKSESFKDLLRYAGGFTEKAYTYTINVRRNTSREIKLLNISQEEVDTFLPNNGDVFTIGTIIERYENRVEVQGAVFRPGNYAIETGLTTIKELIKKTEGLREDAFLNRATLTRRKENYDPEVLSIDLGKILRGETADIPLQREDVLQVYSIGNLREKRSVNIVGEVNAPGEFDFKEGMKVADLILQAKGLKESASYAHLELARRIISHGNADPQASKIEIISFSIDGSLKISDEGSQLTLQPFDIVSIRKAPNYEEQRSVKVLGMVNFPGSYAIQNNKQRISDIIERAGGLRTEGYLEGGKLIRGTMTVGVNLKEILNNPSSQENLQLMQGDELTIPRLLQTVKLTGAVQNPLAVSYKEDFTLNEYIAEAGGYTVNANRKKMYVTYANGVSNQIRKFLIFKKNPHIEPGSEIVIPSFPENRKKGLSAAEAIGLTSSLVSVSIAIITLINNIPK
jgi:protein involved in polysaccharide export with SLBB domain